MFKLLKLNFFFLLNLTLCVLLTACASQTRNYNTDNPTAVQVLVFANEAAVSAYSYNFVTYQQNLQTASHYFTPKGWKDFQNALIKSGNLKAIIDKKMVVSAVAISSPVILDEGIINGKYTWVVQIPMLVNYQTAWESHTQKVIIKLNVVKIPAYIGMRGLGVETFLAQ